MRFKVNVVGLRFLHKSIRVIEHDHSSESLVISSSDLLVDDV